VNRGRILLNDVTVKSRYFDKRAISLNRDDIVVVACMRNEAARLTYFLKYYRGLGVNHFFLIDNNSTDGTEEILQDEPDVSYFKTAASYRGSSAGRLWMQEVADDYAVDHWVLTVDVDELLTFPAAEVLDLRDLCSYMDKSGHEGMFSIMLDMYSDLPLSKTVYEEGADFLDTCPFFETDTYRLAPGANPPFLGVFGGPRGRMFKESGGSGNGPMMKKIALVKWRRGFSYIYSTHSHRFIQLSDITGALLHFKFFDTFEEVAARDSRRGDRRQQADYSTYTAHVESDLSFYGHHSHRLRSPRDLVQLGVMCASSRFDTFCRYTLKERGAYSGSADLLPSPAAPEGKLTLRSVAALWPFLQNPGIARYFGLADLAPRKDRKALIHEMRKHVHVVDIKADHVLLRIDEAALHGWHRSELGLAIFVGERVVATVRVDGSDPALAVDGESLEPSMCRLPVDIAGAAAAAGMGQDIASVAVVLFDGSDPGLSVGSASTVDAAVIRARGTQIFSSSWYRSGATASWRIGFNGVTDKLEDGMLRGWVYDVERRTFEVPVTIFVNDRLVSYTVPSRRRVDLDRMPETHPSSRGKGFLQQIPFGYFADIGATDLRIEAFIAGTNLRLRRTPIVLPIHFSSAAWDARARTWLLAP
jgi:hypothetical protein